MEARFIYYNMYSGSLISKQIGLLLLCGSLSACSPEQSPVSEGTGNEIGIAAGERPPPSFSAESLAEQRMALSKAKDTRDYVSAEDMAKKLINNSIVKALYDQYLKYKASGMEFDKGEYASNVLNYDRRNQHIWEWQTTYEDPAGEFRVVELSIEGDGAMGLLLETGNTSATTLGTHITGNVLDSTGNISASCSASVPYVDDAGDHQDRKFPCSDIVSGAAQGALEEVAKLALNKRWTVN